MSKDSKVNLAVGLDVSDKWTTVHVVTMDSGEDVEESRVRTSREALCHRFAGVERMRVAVEVGTHSCWISRLLGELGHQVIVANAAKIALIYRNPRKRDRADAQTLARLAAFDPRMLHPIQHRSEQAQQDLAVVRSRDQLVQVRTQLICHVRGVVKAMGHRLPSCQAECFAKRIAEEIPQGLEPALAPVLEQIATLTTTIRGYEKLIERLAEQRYGATKALRQVRGVGTITALTYVLVIQDPSRFSTSRSVGAYLGYVPRLDESGESSPRLGTTKQGDALLRRLLVNCAHYILGPFGEDCDLRRFGERVRANAGAGANNKAATAVARKLAVLLHRLWSTGEAYDPFYTARRPSDTPKTSAA